MLIPGLPPTLGGIITFLLTIIFMVISLGLGIFYLIKAILKGKDTTKS